METKLQFIREKCIEANPSIKDLVFGCRFLDDEKEHLIYFAEDGHEMLETVAITNWYGVMELKKHHIGREYVEGKKSELGTPKIIGREIRLSDVLLAIDKEAPYRSISISVSGKIIEQMGYEDFDEHCSWNLLKDSLSSQSPETIDFIFNLLS